MRRAPEPVAFLRANSGLPGPRGNLELMQAAADVGDERDFREWIAAGSGVQPTDEFLVACGAVGLGRLVAEGGDQPAEDRSDLVAELRLMASDPRWRVREAVAMALQRIGDSDVDRLFAIARNWSDGRPYEQRAAIAAVAEPRLLQTIEAGLAAVDLIDRVTLHLTALSNRRSEEVRTLRQTLAYCWSVVVAAAPEYGKPAMERWITPPTPMSAGYCARTSRRSVSRSHTQTGSRHCWNASNEYAPGVGPSLPVSGSWLELKEGAPPSGTPSFGSF